MIDEVKVVSALHKSSYHVQMKAEKMIFHNVECILHMKLEKKDHE